MPHHHPQKRAYADCMNANLHEAVSAWFLGPQAENADILKGLFEETVNLQTQSRLAYYPQDGPFITASIKESQTFQDRKDDLIEKYQLITGLLFDKSIPFFSQRYAGHMSFEMGMPGMLGWVAGVLNNPNNVAFEASPVTTLLEIDVGHDMCEMLGYNEKDDSGQPLYWGHIACDGTVANLESIWVARNLKYYPLSLRDAMKPGNELNYISSTFEVPLPTGQSKVLAEMSLWELLNLTPKAILDVPRRLESEYGITPTYLDTVLGKYIVQTRGKQAVELEWGMKVSPRYFISATKHYSWPKGAALAGLGSENMIDVDIDVNARVDAAVLRTHLEECLEQQIPVFAVVGIIGSTEEGSVDPLDEILDLRDEFAERGLCFLVHADAAWGGYFASMIRDKPLYRMPGAPRQEPNRDFVPSATMRASTIRQFHALERTDSITIDPHKAGYVPYPAGGLCYRDGRMRYLVTWSAPYLQQADTGESIGVYGVEGSKPGAAAVATYLHHEVVGLHKEGHGALLGEVSWSCRRIAAHWAAMSVESDPFIVVPLNPLRAEPDPAGVAREKEFIRSHILGKTNEAIVQDREAKAELYALGSDLNINAFSCNFRINGVANSDVEEANYLNNAIFKRLSITTPNKDPKEIPMFLSATTFKVAEYGVCVQHFKERLQLETDSNQDLFVLRNVVMSPFQTAGNFVQELADIFQGVMEEEMQYVIERNTITPQAQSFVVLGYDANASASKAFLVYRPYFHNANGRFQAILSADIADDSSTSAAVPIIGQDPESGTVFLTSEETTMANICKEGASFRAVVGHSDPSGTRIVKSVQVSNVHVIKDRPLDSRWRDDDYPATFVPFYLFGANGRTFVDHALVKAPNAQLSAEVSLDVSLSAEELARGMLLSVSRPEVAMQPAEAASTAWFASGTRFDVEVFADPNAADEHGPGLVSAIGSTRAVGTGSMVIAQDVYVDFDRLNTQEFTGRETHRFTNFTSRTAHPETKREWRQLMQAAVGHKHGRGPRA
ncbi:PLP-dependent transferase [Phanerochaete sordida]|uniref:PLP-dependent transferase n=1 Tax=Phanerochaete sordida TaxID=48140 RepID=A0A9P3GKJ5_9APHY|nr:PLP-dependent transferase [Phanerochaete sordida]